MHAYMHACIHTYTGAYIHTQIQTPPTSPTPLPTISLQDTTPSTKDKIPKYFVAPVPVSEHTFDKFMHVRTPDKPTDVLKLVRELLCVCILGVELFGVSSSDNSAILLVKSLEIMKRSRSCPIEFENI